MRKIILSLVAIFLSATFVSAQTETPIPINSAADFAKIGVHQDYPLTGSYIQTADINLGTITKSIGSVYYDIDNPDDVSGYFNGTYDGNGKTITCNANFNANLEYDDYNGYASYGLFGVNNGVIENLKVIANNVSFQGAALDLGLVCGCNLGEIFNCEVNGTISNGAKSTGLVAGSSIGENSIIQNCIAVGSLNGTKFTGGIVGESEGTIKACSFVGDIISYGYGEPDDRGRIKYYAYVGGIAGQGTVISSYANPRITPPETQMQYSGYYGMWQTVVCLVQLLCLVVIV